MNSLKNYISESLLGDVNELIKDDSFADILNFIQENYCTFPTEPKSYSIYKLKNIHVVDVYGNLELNEDKTTLTNGKFKFGHVYGYFDCSRTQITSLEGAPDIVDKFFDCSGCKNLTSLEGGPSEVKGSYYSASMNDKLTSLEGGPTKILGDFNCMHCKNLTSLEGGPTYVGGNYQAINCPKLKNLAGVDVVKGFLDIRKCKKILDSKSMSIVSKNINRIIS